MTPEHAKRLKKRLEAYDSAVEELAHATASLKKLDEMSTSQKLRIKICGRGDSNVMVIPESFTVSEIREVFGDLLLKRKEKLEADMEEL